MNTQRKKSVSDWLVILAIIAFIAIMILRLFPMYQEYYYVIHIMDSMEQELSNNRLTKQQAMTLLIKRFDAGLIDSVKKDNIDIYRGRNDARAAKIVVDYEVRSPLIANLDAIGHFHKEIDIEQ